MNPARDFVERLQAVSLLNVFNPYADHCELHDLKDGAAIRRENLVSALSAAIELGVRSIWVARDLGYRGGRRTGLALTDEVHLSAHSRLLGGVPIIQATTGAPVAERTATTIWRMINQIEEPIFMWNAFPLHPHEPDKPLSNRCHTRAELKATDWVLPDLINLLKPSAIYTIGADAKRCLQTLEINTVAFRHPSYGGQTQFTREVSEVYRLPPAPYDRETKKTRLAADQHTLL